MHVIVWILVAFVVGLLVGRWSAAERPRTVSAETAQPQVPLVAANRGVVTLPAVIGDANGAYRITLVDSGTNLINTVKAVRQVTRLGLKDAKDVAEGAPCELIRVNSAEGARAVALVFQGVASLQIAGPDGTEELPHPGGTRL